MNRDKSDRGDDSNADGEEDPNTKDETISDDQKDGYWWKDDRIDRDVDGDDEIDNDGPPPVSRFLNSFASRFIWKSTAPKGEPRYPVTNPAVFKPDL